MDKKAVMTIANTLVYKFKMTKSEALKQAWQMVKSGFSTNLSNVTYGRRQSIINNLKPTAGAYLMREHNKYNSNSVIVVVNGQKVGYLKDKATAVVNALISKGYRIGTQIINRIGGGELNYGLTVGLKLIA